MPLSPLEVYFLKQELNCYHAELKRAGTSVFTTEPQLTLEFVRPSVSLFKTDFTFEESLQASQRQQFNKKHQRRPGGRGLGGQRQYLPSINDFHLISTLFCLHPPFLVPTL